MSGSFSCLFLDPIICFNRKISFHVCGVLPILMDFMRVSMHMHVEAVGQVLKFLIHNHNASIVTSAV